jgi:hypothetical protein
VGDPSRKIRWIVAPLTVYPKSFSSPRIRGGAGVFDLVQVDTDAVTARAQGDPADAPPFICPVLPRNCSICLPRRRAVMADAGVR